MTKQELNEGLVAQIVSAYAARPGVTPDEIAELTLKLTRNFDQKADSEAPAWEVEEAVPAIPIEEAVTPSKVYCLCCGKGFKMLKRHIGAEHGLTEAQYRAKFGLADDFPLVAPEYSKRKASAAKKLGLGKYDRKQADAVG